MLKDKLVKIRSASAAKRSADTLAIMKQAKENLSASGIMDKTIRVGDKVPSFSLEDGHGKKVKLASFLQQGPVIMAIYRGVW